MTEFSERESGRFMAKDDNGNIYSVVEYQKYASFSPVNQGTQIIKQGKRYTLDDGAPIQEGEGGALVVVDTGTIIRKV